MLLRSGLVGVGPRYALFFYLLRDTPVDAYMHGLPVSHGWFIGAEHCRVSAPLWNETQFVSRRSVLRTSPPLLSERGVLQVSLISGGSSG